jgi:FixJ family two-component response regulator
MKRDGVPAGSDNVPASSEEPIRVAILDDDPSVRTAIGRLVSACGMTGSCFANCMELFNGIVQLRPDCIILDLYMPGLDGLEVMNYLRKNGEKAPIILVTAQDDPALRDICLKAGASAFMRKPLPASDLLDVITQLVGPSGHGSARQGLPS